MAAPHGMRDLNSLAGVIPVPLNSLAGVIPVPLNSLAGVIPVPPEVEAQSPNHWIAKELPELPFFLRLNNILLYVYACFSDPFAC